MSAPPRFTRREIIRIGGLGIAGAAVAHGSGAEAGVPVSGVIVTAVQFTWTLSKTRVDKFAILQNRCMVILGDPTPPATPGIMFKGQVSLRPVIVGNKKPDYGTLHMVQNVNFNWRRSPPLHPDPLHRLFSECAGSQGAWALDKPISPVVTLNGPATPPIYGQDSPGVFLEEASTAFEHVTATSEFRTYLIHTTHGVPHVLARIDWSWSAEATSTGAHKGRCVSDTLPEGWILKKGVPQASPAVYGTAASSPPPVSSPAADPTHWVLC